jgi:hypothetical protein
VLHTLPRPPRARGKRGGCHVGALTHARDGVAALQVHAQVQQAAVGSVVQRARRWCMAIVRASACARARVCLVCVQVGVGGGGDWVCGFAGVGGCWGVWGGGVGVCGGGGEVCVWGGGGGNVWCVCLGGGG